ncbi:hypothetical protein PTI98_011036 [Pleurotus ostreatus]|nr:hypothetical protein PTI98_011036 [Pleurotus ostreatus]
MAPRPPYATDIPDEEYDSPQAQTRRLRQPKPQDPSARSSTYDVYNNYLAAGDNNPNSTPNPNDRNSGVGALGLGLMTADMSDDDDDSDDERDPRPNAKQQQQQGGDRPRFSLPHQKTIIIHGPSMPSHPRLSQRQDQAIPPP